MKGGSGMKIKYSKPEIKHLSVKEQVAMASAKLECSERGCCVKSFKHVTV